MSKESTTFFSFGRYHKGLIKKLEVAFENAVDKMSYQI
jgi:hypothetical protein